MKSEYLNELNEKQREAVLHKGGPLLILAGAGSGKTKTITHRAAYLIDSAEAGEEEVLLVTFTNKAAQEMKERVHKISGKNVGNIGTFHSLGAKILRRNGSQIGIDPYFVIYDDKDQLALVKDIVGELDIDDKRFRPRSLLYSIMEAKQELIDPETYERIAKGVFQEVVADVYHKYQKYLKKYGALDFEDLLIKTVELLKQNDDVRSHYQSRYPYVFVDEYQDTNGVQYVLTKLLMGENKNLTVVGDASQSIYGWRGADYRNITRLKKDFPDITEIRLERNYRSSQNILDAADQVISNNRNHPVLSLWTDKGGGERIGLGEHFNGKEEAEWVTSKILELKRANGYEWGEMAILYRTNAQSREFEESLIRSSVPYVLIGGTKFYERAEIKDIISYFRVLINPDDLISLKRAEKIGKRRLSRLEEAREQIDINELNTSELFDVILEKTSYMDKYDEEVAEDLARIENIRELESVAREFPVVSEFLENIALVQSEYYQDEKSGKGESVVLTTIHASKGLEYPVVFLVGMEEGLFPHSRSLEDKEALEEERRLCYVGITRAKERLYMSYAKKRMVWGTSSMQMRSRFLDEIDQGLFDRQFVATQGSGSDLKLDSTRTVKIDALSDSTLERFLEGEIDIDELLR